MSHDKRYASVFRDGLLEGQVILVTGGGSGIGRCIAHEAASLGATVVVAGRNPGKLEEVAAEIAEASGQAWPLVLDIRDAERVDAAVAEVVARHGRLDGVVNNAGGQFPSPAVAITPKGWRAVVDTNLNGTWFVSQAAFKHAMSRSGGVIVNIVADMWNGFPGMAHTGAARAGVVNLTCSLAVEWGGAGVRVNAVAPGYVLSSGMKNYPPLVQEMAAQLLWKNPSGRLATESEVSSAVCFLLGPGAAYITGVALRVDGGSSLHKASMFPFVRHDRMKAFRGFHLDADLPDRFRELEPD